jgi:hypothetical protein
MPKDCNWRRLATVGSLCAAPLLLAACGGGDDSSLASSTDAAALTAATLLDDDGGVMPSDPRAVPEDAAAAGARARRYATTSQARDLQRALGREVQLIEVGCCGDVAVAHAIAAARALDARPHQAVLVSGSDAQLGAEVVEILVAAGLDRVWWVSP